MYKKIVEKLFRAGPYATRLLNAKLAAFAATLLLALLAGGSVASAIPILFVDRPETSDVPLTDRSLVQVAVGQIEKDRLWVDGSWHQLQQLPNDPNSASQPTTTTPLTGPDASRRSDPERPATAQSAVFMIPVNSTGGCDKQRRLKDFEFFVKSVAKKIERIVIEGEKRKSSCIEMITDVLASTRIPVDVSDQGNSPQAQELVVRTVFKDQSEVKRDVVDATKAPTSDPPVERADLLVANQEDVRIYINQKPVEISQDGWFANEITSGTSAALEVRANGRIVFQKQIGLMILRLGFNTGYTSTRWNAVVLKTGPQWKAEIREADENALRGFGLPLLSKVSVPVYIKVGIGYASVDPLPDERGRMALHVGARSYPFFSKFHLAADLVATSKEDSKVPRTITSTGFIGTDLARLSSNWSLPMGLGVRVFQSMISKDEEILNQRKSIKIPKAVLSPALQAGTSWRSGLVYVNASVTFATVFVSGVAPILTLNPQVAAGYQITPVDILALQMNRDDIRYPSLRGEAAVVVSSLLLSYQRDLL
jgi:hypothetical protein